MYTYYSARGGQVPKYSQAILRPVRAAVPGFKMPHWQTDVSGQLRLTTSGAGYEITAINIASGVSARSFFSDETQVIRYTLSPTPPDAIVQESTVRRTEAPIPPRIRSGCAEYANHSSPLQ